VPTRRTVLLGGASAALLAGCGRHPARLIAGDPADLPVLAAALEVERAQVALYEVGARLASGRESTLVRQILAHERRHAQTIAEAIQELGAEPGGPRPRALYERGVPRALDAWRQHAIQMEETWSAGYAAAIPKLANRRLRATFGALMTTEAEHAVALSVA
jgi:rubrerythrin